MSRDSSLVDNLNSLINARLNTVNTQLPAKVTSVNYETNSLNAKPLIATRYSDEAQVDYPELFDIPFMILSGNSGNARITIPIQVGDTVLVEFAQRDLQGFYQSDGKTLSKSYSGTAMGMYPILAIPCLYTARSAKPISSSDIVIENGSSSITMTPNGDVTIRANVDIIGGRLTHNGINVGDDHKHSGVMSGGSVSGAPV